MERWRRNGSTLAAGAAVVVLCWVLPDCVQRFGLNAPSHVYIGEDPFPDPRDGPPIDKVRIEQGALAFGFPRLEVDGQGRALFRYRRCETGNGERFESEFTLSSEELAALHGLITKIGFSKMNYAYYPHLPINDGEVCTFTVVRGGLAKEVFCDNAFPRGLWRLKEMAFKTLPAAHAREIEETGRKIGE